MTYEARLKQDSPMLYARYKQGVFTLAEAWKMMGGRRMTYNLHEAGKALLRGHAYLARQMDSDKARLLAPAALEAEIERWRETVMDLCNMHKRAHEEIKRLRGSKHA